MIIYHRAIYFYYCKVGNLCRARVRFYCSFVIPAEAGIYKITKNSGFRIKCGMTEKRMMNKPLRKTIRNRNFMN